MTAAGMRGLLLDTSVHLRRGRPVVGRALERIATQRVRYRCAVIELELLHATGSTLYTHTRSLLHAAYPELAMTVEVHDRALEVQGLLAESSQHAGVSVPDLLIAACAEVHGATVLHYDADFDAIAAVTGQPTEWVVPRGTVDQRSQVDP